MFATLCIGIETRTGATLVPRGAVLRERSGASVFRPVDGRAVKTPVKTGFDDGDRVEILGGIAPGEEVLVPGPTALTDGQRVEAVRSPE